jgi:hypothetical protein
MPRNNKIKGDRQDLRHGGYDIAVLWQNRQKSVLGLDQNERIFVLKNVTKFLIFISALFFLIFVVSSKNMGKKHKI